VAHDAACMADVRLGPRGVQKRETGGPTHTGIVLETGNGSNGDPKFGTPRNRVIVPGRGLQADFWSTETLPKSHTCPQKRETRPWERPETGKLGLSL
jgi:hypothetical protein